MNERLGAVLITDEAETGAISSSGSGDRCQLLLLLLLDDRFVETGAGLREESVGLLR